MKLSLRTPAKLALRVIEQRLGQNRPLFATFFVTARCNVRCDGCVYYDNLDDRVGRAREETGRALSILSALADEGVPIVAFAGGEPFLRKDLGELLRAGKAHGFSLSVITNAMVLDDDALDAADASCDEVVFSPHPPSELGGGSPEAKYEQSWIGFARMRRAIRRPTLTCAIALGKHTAPLLDDIIRRAVEIGADRVKYQPNFFPEQFPPRAEVDEMARVLREWTRREPKRMEDPRIFLDHLSDFFGERPRVACTADRRFNIGVFLDGTVSACCPAHVPIGNLFDQPISSMLSEKIGTRDDCYGCHRVDAVKALQICGS